MKLTILPEIQRKLWEKLAGVKQLKKCYLAGGTAVALHLAHRESIDFDFFSEDKIDFDTLLLKLSILGKLTIDEQSEDTFLATLDNVKLSFFHYPYPLLCPAVLLKKIKVASLDDLVAMKIVAISQRGTKKDFIDLHTILGAGWNFDLIFNCVERKYKNVNYNKMHFLKSLTYFVEADSDPMPKMLGDLSWQSIKEELLTKVRSFTQNQEQSEV